jgi:hypothetical protein
MILSKGNRHTIDALNLNPTLIVDFQMSWSMTYQQVIFPLQNINRRKRKIMFPE